MPEAIRVNFGRPMPVLPLPEAVLLPHEIQPLHIREPRYRQMISDCLSGDGQMAVATFEDCLSCFDDDDEPTLRPAVCVGQIVQHSDVTQNRQEILLQGICRARIVHVLEATNGRGYRMAKLAPLEPLDQSPPPMVKIREQLRQMLIGPRLRRLRSAETVMKWFDRDDVSTHALLELIGFALLPSCEVKYRLLAEASPIRRARLIKHELANLDQLVEQADHQPFKNWPKGMSWN
jgi:Lon protease-like protein